MADDNILGAVKIEIRGDWSKLASDFASAEGTARNLAASITGNLNSAFQQVNATATVFGNSVRAAVSNAGASIGSLNTATQQMAANLGNAATQAQALSGSFRNLVASLNAQAAAAQTASQAYQQLATAATAAATATGQSNAAASSSIGIYRELGLITRTVRIAEFAVRGIEALHDLAVAARDADAAIQAEFSTLRQEMQSTGDQLDVANTKIANTLARLSGKPENAIAAAMQDAAVEADKFSKQTEGDIDKIHKAFKTLEISPAEGFLKGQQATGGLFSNLSDLFNKSGALGKIPQGVTEANEKAAESIRKASDAIERQTIVKQRDEAITGLYSQAITVLRQRLAEFVATPTPDVRSMLIPGGLPGIQSQVEGVEILTQAINTLQTAMTTIPKLEIQGLEKPKIEQQEIERQNAARSAIVPRASAEKALSAINEETSAREKASQQAIALAKETARGEIEAMRDPHARAIADAQEELALAKRAQAELLATQKVQLPQQTAKITQIGNLGAAGKPPEEAQVERINAEKQVQEVQAAAARERTAAASTVAVAEAKVTTTVKEQNREIDQATQKTAAKLAATRESTALEAQALQVEREVGVAAGATGAVKITQMRAQADAQAAQRDGEVRRLQQEADAEGEQTKKAELLAQAEEKRLENANKTYAAETKILEVMAQQAKQLAEIETKRSGAVEDAGLGQQKALAQRAATLQGPGITPQATAANEIALKQQLLALDTQQHSLDVERLTTQGDIAALYGDQIAAAKDYAEADKAAADGLTKEIQQQTEILALQKQQTLQAELQGNLRSALSGAEAGVGQGVAGAVLGKKGPGDSVGQEIEKSLRNVGQQLFGNVLTNVIRQLVTSLTANTAAAAAMHAIFGTALPAQATATNANTGADHLNTAATQANTAALIANTASQNVNNAASAAKGIGGLLSGGLGGLLGKLFGVSAGAVGVFAEGGSPPVGVTSIVGENGPELFVPKEAGTIVPAGKFGPAGGAGSYGAALPALPSYSNVTNSGSVSIGSFHMQVHGPSSPKQFASEVMKEIAYRAKSQGGPGFSPLSRAFQGASGGTNS